MNNLQARKALNKKVLAWSEERQKHHTKCDFTTSWESKCNCNYTLNKCVCTDTPPYQECSEHNGY